MKNNLFISLLVILLTFSCKEKTITTKNTKELSFKLITTDLDNFWNAYDALRNSRDSVSTFQKLYIDKASPEFKKFLELRSFTAKKYKDEIVAAPKFWESIRPLTLSVKGKEKEITDIYHKMSNLYDDFRTPNVCFAISPLMTGGTTDRGLILIGTEIAVVNPNKVNISEIKGFLGKIFQNNSGDIQSLIAHELVHTQQPGGDNENTSLLSQSITEGASDFLATLILNKQSMNNAIFEYGENNEKALWKEFSKDIEANKTVDDTDWFYDYNSDRPADLGYYIGYKIVEAYYNNATDKKEAIKDIIQMEKPSEFLLKSKYGE